jgi:hypothetical protein
VEDTNRPSAMEEKLEERLKQVKSHGAMDMTSDEAGRASKEARKGGGKRRRGKKGKRRR